MVICKVRYLHKVEAAVQCRLGAMLMVHNNGMHGGGLNKTGSRNAYIRSPNSFLSTYIVLSATRGLLRKTPSKKRRSATTCLIWLTRTGELDIQIPLDCICLTPRVQLTKCDAVVQVPRAYTGRVMSWTMEPSSLPRSLDNTCQGRPRGLPSSEQPIAPKEEPSESEVLTIGMTST